MYDVDTAKDKQLNDLEQADAFTRFLHVATRGSRLISITLSNRKWYVGYVAEAPSLNPNEKYFRILPLVSGYRDKDTLETLRTTFYEEVLKTAKSGDFVVTPPIADVQTANFFDPDLYDEHFSEDDDAGAYDESDDADLDDSEDSSTPQHLPAFVLERVNGKVRFELDSKSRPTRSSKDEEAKY
jgi:hypothetical protein